MALEEFFLSVESLIGEFLSSNLHFLPRIYLIFTCVDPAPQHCLTVKNLEAKQAGSLCNCCKLLG